MLNVLEVIGHQWYPYSVYIGEKKKQLIWKSSVEGKNMLCEQHQRFYILDVHIC